MSTQSSTSLEITTTTATKRKFFWVIISTFISACVLVTMKTIGLKDDEFSLFQGTSKKFYIKTTNSNNKNKNKSKNKNKNNKNNEIGSTANGIPLLPLLEFINQSAGPLPRGQLYPDCIYFIESESAAPPKDENVSSSVTAIQQKLPKATLHMSMNGYWKHNTYFRRRKLTPDLDLLTNAMKELQSHPNDYPRLWAAIFEQEQPGGGGFPFIVNWDPRITLINGSLDEARTSSPSNSTFIPPIFRQLASATESVSASSSLKQSSLMFFPIATSSSYVNNKGFPQHYRQWNKTQENWKTEFPWNTKEQKVLLVSVHDGDESNNDDNTITPTSLIMGQLQKNQQRQHQQRSNSLFHTKAINIQQNNNLDAKSRTIFRMEEQQDEEFLIQNVSAIFVIDGNKGLVGIDSQKLLCLNSILILMLEEEGKEMSHSNKSSSTTTTQDMYFPSTIEPWKHYIPLMINKSSPSSINHGDSMIFNAIVKMREYIYRSENTNQILKIIQNANEWCQTHMLYSELIRHLLMEWTKYLEELDKADSNWPTQWNKNKQEYLEGHFLKTRDTAYSISPQIVGKMKGGFRRDEFDGDCQLISECDA